MENTEVQHPLEQQDDELEEALVTRRNNHYQTPVSITIKADFSSNNVASIGVTSGKHQHQQEEQENEDEDEEKLKDFSQQNGIKVDEDEKRKERQQYQQYQQEEEEQENEDEYEEKLEDFSQQNGIKVDEDEKERVTQHQGEEQENEDEEKNDINVDEDEKEKEKQQTSQYSVYYDTDKGVWKCRICSWDHQGRTCLTRHSHHSKPQSHILVNVKTKYGSKGNGLHFESSLVEAIGVESDANGKPPMPGNTDITKHNRENGNGLHSVITNQYGEYQNQEILFEEIVKRPASYINNKTDTSEIQVIKDGDDETSEYDVEAVLKKQDTHDLFCPNCNSCITKRVILRKRKRRIPVIGDDAKRNKPEVNVVHSQVNVVLDAEPPISNEFDHQREEPDVFRCLSCFSIFMPTVNGFKLFRMFGNKNNQVYKERPQKEVPVKKHWFSNFFASNEEQLNNQGTIQSLDMENNVSGLPRQEANSHDNDGTTDLDKKQLQSAISSVGRDGNIPLSSTQEPIAPQQQIATKSDNTNGTIDLDKNQLQSAISSVGREGNVPLSSTQEPVAPQQQIATKSDNTNGTTYLDEKQLQSVIVSVGRDGNVSLSSSQEPDALEQQIVKESDNTRIESNGRIEENLLAEQSNSQSEYSGTFVAKPAENAVFPSQHDGLKLLVPSNGGSLIIENSQTNQGFDFTVQMNNPGLDEKGRMSLSFPSLASNHGHSNLGGQTNDPGLQNNLDINGKEQKTFKDRDIVPEVTEQYSVQNNVEILLDEPLKVNKDVLTDKQIKLLEDFNNTERNKGKDTIITIESKQPDASAYQTLTEGGTSALQQVQSGNQAVAQGGATIATEGGRSLDIIKSIVYGGLIELITSLSVVSSAAGADAATLNVLALGLANIFGGLFVICHDLWDLKNERTRKSEDRYQLLLGQRTDFPLHMAVSLISYLVFGFLPPIVYAFSFRASNDRDLKLLMVAAASIVCILILAAAKAYVQSPRKSYFKTICYYVVFGFMVSGVSYLFGGLIMKLLEKMDIFHSGSVDNLSIHGSSSKPALVATY